MRVNNYRNYTRIRCFYLVTTTYSCAIIATLMPAVARADTLREAVAAAYANNPALQGSRELAEAADEGVTQARGAYGPTLSVSARHTYTAARIRGTAFPSENEGFASSAELTLSQSLFTSGRLAANLDAAQAARMAERERLRGASQQLIMDVVNAYVSLQRDIEIHGVAVEIYRLLLQQRDVTAARYRLRASTQPDLDQAANRLELAAGRVIAARATVETSAARYRNLVGSYPAELAPLPPLPALPALEALYAEAETHSPGIAAARFTELQSRAAVAAARAEMRPQVSAFASAGRSPASPYQNTLREEAVAAGIGLSMPLYTGDQLSAALRAAIDRNLADQQFAEQTRRDVRETLATDWSLLRSATEAMPRFEAAVRAAERAVEGVKRQETSGIRTLRDVLDVTSDLLAARTGAVQTLSEIYLRRVAVLRDTGLLSIETLAPGEPQRLDANQPAAAALAGLPLRPVLEPVDRLLLDQRVPAAPVQREDARVFEWSAMEVDPLQPPAATGSED